MDNSPFPIFVINLKRSPERKANISNQLNALGLEHQFIEAVDGMQFTPQEVVEKYGEQVFYANTYDGQRMTLGAVGCLLSHIKIYDMMIEKNISVACILEDDAELSPSFPEILRSKVLAEVSWGTLLCCHHSMYRKSMNKGAEAVYWRKKVCSGYYIARAAEFPLAAQGYLIKLPTARKLRDLAFPIRMPADWVTANTELVSDTLRIITPPCIVSNKEYLEKSTIRDSGHVVFADESQNKTHTLSLSRNLIVGLASIIFGTKEQRAAAAYDSGKSRSTYRPETWQLTQDEAVERDIEANIIKKQNPTYETIKQHARRSRHAQMLLDIINQRLVTQKVLWSEIKKACSTKGFFQANLRFILNIPIVFFTILLYLIQHINRTIYYGKTLSTIRIYIKKTGLFKYTRRV